MMPWEAIEIVVRALPVIEANITFMITMGVIVRSLQLDAIQSFVLVKKARPLGCLSVVMSAYVIGTDGTAEQKLAGADVVLLAGINPVTIVSRESGKRQIAYTRCHVCTRSRHQRRWSKRSGTFRQPLPGN